MNLSLKLYPTHVRIMVYFLRNHLAGQEAVPLRHQHVGTLVLLKYLDSWSAVKLLSWQHKNPKKQFKLTLKLAEAKALHDFMQGYSLNPLEQALLNELDQAIVNYQAMYSSPMHWALH